MNKRETLRMLAKATKSNDEVIAVLIKEVFTLQDEVRDLNTKLNRHERRAKHDR